MTSDQPASVGQGPSMTFDEVTVKVYLSQNPSSDDPVIASLIKAMQSEKYYLMSFMIVTEQNKNLSSSNITEESFCSTIEHIKFFLREYPLRETEDTAYENPFKIPLRYAKTKNDTYVGKLLKSSFSQDMIKDLHFGFWFGSSDEFLIKELFEDFISEYTFTLRNILDSRKVL